ncbi:lipoyl protein ligase domain-containing protein [Microbacterium sp.]|uniref:lipoyl protein ligase domain-containing protein n=1 Tax=Microbacterium sp. TaxID=51671 RepID=UPI0039197762
MSAEAPLRIRGAALERGGRELWAGRGREGAPGVYTTDGAKIAALGLRVRRGCSFHGLAFTVAMDLEPFRRINPCGYAGQPVTMLAERGGPADLGAVARILVPQLSAQLGLSPAWQDGPIPAA